MFKWDRCTDRIGRQPNEKRTPIKTSPTGFVLFSQVTDDDEAAAFVVKTDNSPFVFINRRDVQCGTFIKIRYL